MDHICQLKLHKLKLKMNLIKKQRNFKKPTKQPDLGYFLAGLIDADGYLRKKELAITLSVRDIGLGLCLKQTFGGRLRKYKQRNAFNYELNNVAQLRHMANLIRHKLRYAKRVEQYNSALAPSLGCAPTTVCSDPLDTNYWFCGFTFGDGSFQIKLSHRNKTKVLRAQVSLQFSLSKDALPILMLIKDNFGGSIGYRKPNTVYYGSGSVANASKIITYFESYPMVFRQRRLLELFKRAYDIISTKRHLSPSGMEDLLRLRKLASALRQSKFAV